MDAFKLTVFHPIAHQTFAIGQRLDSRADTRHFGDFFKSLLPVQIRFFVRCIDVQGHRLPIFRQFAQFLVKMFGNVRIAAAPQVFVFVTRKQKKIGISSA